MTTDSRSIPIERIHGLTQEAFHQRYLSGAGKPVIVTDALITWRAPSNWSFDLFKSRYAAETVVVTNWPGDKLMKMMKFGDYIDYLDDPGKTAPGFWVDPVTRFPRQEPPEPTRFPLYLSGWRAFNLHPELLDDVVLSPQFVEDFLPLLPPAFRNVLDGATRYFSAGVLIGPAGSVASLHHDFLHSHAYLAQILGKKKCVLFPPEDSASLYDGHVDPDRPDFEKFPLFRNAKAYECILQAGELLFIPSRWWHHVVALEKSITVNYNFFNRVNFSGYLTDLLKGLPAILAGFEASPEAKEALGIDWVSKGFESINSE